MKIKNLLGISINLLLILAGITFIVAPAALGYQLLSSGQYFSETQNGFTKDAIADIFYKGNGFVYGNDITPVINDVNRDKADLPAQITPELMTKFIMAQAYITNSMAEMQAMMIWGPFVIGMFFAIGIIAILLGISLFLMWRKLNALSGEKEPVKEVNKETKNKSIIYRNGKPNWILIAAILAATVLVGLGLVAVIRHINDLSQTQISYSGEVVDEHDGVCDATVNNVCDPDCPTMGPDADPDCAQAPAQQSKTNASTTQELQNNTEPANTSKTEIITYQPHRDSATQYKTVSGDCWEGSVAANRADAYRCIASNQISDPCFVLPNEKMLICDFDIVTGKGGFLLQPTKDLSAGALWPNNIQGWAMQVQLASGEICSFTGGATLDIKGGRLNYLCGDSVATVGMSTVIYGDLTVGSVWKANVANLELDATTKEWRTISTKVVDIDKVWQ